MHGREKRIQISVGEPEGKSSNLDVAGRIILEWILKG
jgi:hypothetical protein